MSVIANTLIRERGRFRCRTPGYAELVVPVRFAAEENELTAAYGGRVAEDGRYRAQDGSERVYRIWRLSRIPELRRALRAKRDWGKLTPQANLVLAWLRERERGRDDPDAIEAWEAIWQ